SGHYYFRDEHYGFDDGIYSALRLLKILYRKGIKLHDLTKNFPKSFITPRIRVRVGDTSKFEIIEILRRETRNLSADRIITIDGVRVEYEKGWYLIRASNTQPDIVLRVEGDDREMLQKLYKEAVNLLERAAEKLNIKLDIKSVG
ncbi:MAG: phosphomannomutase/phosphoglucomutase, partial [Thermoproteota archaeon]